MGWLRAGLLCLAACWAQVAHAAAPLPVYEPLAQRVGLLPARSALPALIARAEEQLALCQGALGEAHHGTGEAQLQLGLLLLYHGEAARAEAVLRSALGPLPASGPGRVQALVGLSAALGVQKLTQESLGAGLQAMALRQSEAAAGEELLQAEVLAAATYLRAGEPGPALGLLQQAAADSPLSGAGVRRAAAVWDLYAAALHAAGRWERAQAAQREVVAALRQPAGGEVRGEDRLAAESNLAVLLAGTGREAEAALRGPGAAPELVELRRALHLAEAAEARGQPAEAEAALAPVLPLSDGPLAAQVEVRLRLALLLLGPRAARMASRPGVMLASMGDETGRSLPGPGESDRLRQGLELLRSGADGLAQEAEQVLPAQAPGWAWAGLRGSVAALWGRLLDREAVAALPEQVGRALLRAAQAPQLAQELEEELAALGQGPAEAAEEADELRALWRRRAALYLQQVSEPPGPWRERLSRLSAEIGVVEERAAQRSQRLRQLFLLRDSGEAGVPADGPVVVFRRVLVPVEGAARAEAPVVLVRGGRRLPPLRLQDRALVPGTRGLAEHYAALWLQREQQAQLVDLGPVEAVDAAADRIAPLAERDQGAAQAAALQGELAQLGRLLLDPLPAPTGRVYLMVPPELAAVPWAALPLRGAKALCQHGVPVVLGSLADLARGGPTRRAARAKGRGLQPMLLLGTPLYRESVQRALRLPEPQRGPGEMTGLNQLLRRHRFDARGGPLFALAATRTRLLSWLPAAVVHLSVPVVIEADPGAAAAQERAAAQLGAHPEAVPLLVPAASLPARGGARAALVLAAGALPVAEAGPPGGQDEGLLSTAELARLDLSQTALFDLSAPAPQGSAQAAGAGLWGLRRAAHRAGALGVVVSLWRGPEPTAPPGAQRLMLRVYKAWLQSGDVVAAVHRVQAEAAQRGESPAVWGGLLASQ